MSSPSERLADLGLTLPDVPIPAGAYVPAMVIGGAARCSGQLPFANGSLSAVGIVSDDGPVTPAIAAAASMPFSRSIGNG